MLIFNALRSIDAPSMAMTLEILVGDFAVAKKSLQGKFQYAYAGPWPSSICTVWARIGVTCLVMMISMILL